MNDYEERKQERIERLKDRASKARSQASALSETAREMASVIPFGQPILVGHHSEKGDRSFRNRIHNKTGKSVEASHRADYYEQRAEAAENNRAISSDDPEATTKLREKIERAEKRQGMMKIASKIIRKKISDDEKVSELQKALDWKEETCRKLLEKDCFGGIGFPQYELTNNNANIRRMKERIVDLESRESQETKETDHGEFKVVENVEENRIQLIFPGKPEVEIRQVLKSHGFRWSPRNMAWQRHLNNAGRFAVDSVVKNLSA